MPPPSPDSLILHFELLNVGSSKGYSANNNNEAMSNGARPITRRKNPSKPPGQKRPPPNTNSVKANKAKKPKK